MILKALGSISAIFDSREACESGVGGCNCPWSRVSGSKEGRLSTAPCVSGTLVGSAVEDSVVSSAGAVVILAFVEDNRGS